MNAYSSGVNVALSFKSAPAQKLESTSLARMSALVEPVPPSACMLFTWCVSSASNCLDIALRAAGRFNDSIRMLPECGAGTTVTLIAGAWAVAYPHLCIERNSNCGRDRAMRGIV